MITAYDDAPLLKNDEFWITQVSDRDFVLSDRRDRDNIVEHEFHAEVLSTFTKRGSVQYAFMYSHISNLDTPFTIFFVVRNPDRSDVHVTDLRRVIPGDRRQAIRDFEQLTLSEMAVLFGL